jgi:hypothetical protein
MEFQAEDCLTKGMQLQCDPITIWNRNRRYFFRPYITWSAFDITILGSLSMELKVEGLL